MKAILWPGIVPLLYGLRLLWRWTFVDARYWDSYPGEYRRGLPLRILVALVVTGVGLFLFSQVTVYLQQRYWGR